MSSPAVFAKLVTQQAGGRARVDLGDLWRAFLECRPELGTSPDKRAVLGAFLNVAAGSGLMVLPKGKACYDRSAVPALPKWVTVPVEKPAGAAPAFDHRTHPWCPALQFIATLARLPKVEEALTLHRYLVENRTLDPVPVKERSYAIFGDEKRLDSLLKGVLSQVTLEQLGCCEPAIVPVHRVFSDATRVLIVENEATFDSFCRWNRKNLCWGTVVFGRGIEIWKSVSFLCSNWPEGTRYDYFGDFDQEGVCIANRQAKSMEERGRFLRPLVPAYQYLSRLEPREDMKTHTTDWPDAIQWLRLEDVIAVARRAFEQNKRVAQEAFGWEVLRGLPSTHFGPR